MENIITEATTGMKKAIAHLEAELLKIRAGKATHSLVDGIVCEYYGNPTPIAQVANISVVDARTLTLQPFEKHMIAVVEKAILQSNIGVTPQNDGIVIRLFMPPLTEERRKEFAKRGYAEGETAKVAIRSVRRDAFEAIKKAQKDGLSEDIAKDAETKVQAITDKNIALVDTHCTAKEKELMVV